MITKFEKRPRVGMLVKVYYPTNSVSYGKVIGLSTGKDDDEPSKHREILVLEPSAIRHNINDCDFCLPENKVAFNGEPTILSPEKVSFNTY